MKTIVYKIITSKEDKLKILDIQQKYCMDFRKLYNNLDLSSDRGFLNNLKTKSSKLKECLVKEVISFYEKYESGKDRIIKRIQILEEEGKEKNFKKLSQLKRSLNSKICFGGRENLKKRTKGLITSDEWKELRLYPIVFYGETSRKGNRFFDFKDLSNGNILFKLDKKTRIPIKIWNNKHKEELIKLQSLSMEKKIPITVKLRHNEIHLSFDESILNDTKFDHKLLQKDKPVGLDKDMTKEYWKKKYREHEDRLKVGKLDRWIAIDINPNEIGYSISDKDLNILDRGCYKIVGEISENKRKHEYSQIIKDLFKKVKHFKISYFVIEDLENINKDNFGNKISNRKNKLEFKKNYIFSLISRRCNETGTILRKVNPCYSSFIGNLTFREYDPIASSIEILRRGIGQFSKGFKLIPEFHIDNLITDRLDDGVDLSGFNNFVELFKSIRDKSYRIKDLSFSSQKFTKGEESHVFLCF